MVSSTITFNNIVLIAGINAAHHLYGMSDMTPYESCVSPACGVVWPAKDVSQHTRPAVNVLKPSPSSSPPIGFSYPQAPIFHLNEEIDLQYTSGWYYWADHDTAQHIDERDHLLRITTPPSVQPTSSENGDPLIHAIPGMVQMPPGIPFVHVLDHKDMITIACLHTLNSLSLYPDGGTICNLANELMNITWNGLSRDGKQYPPVFDLDGLKRNDCSAVPALDSHSPDGSYNIASTVSQGHGQGIVLPAVQAATDDAQIVMGATNKCLHGLYRSIMPKMISKTEWEAIEFNAIDNNVIGFGGLEPNNTGLQMNVSSVMNGDSLADAIGNVQGSWHVDKSDDPSHWTLMTLLLRLPPGKCFVHYSMSDIHFSIMEFRK